MADWSLYFRIAICVVGTFGNVTLLLSAVRNAELREKFTLALRVLIAAEAFIDSFVCGFGFPLLTINQYYADASWNGWPCHVVVMSTWAMASSSFWCLTMIALTRVAAVFTPNRFRELAKMPSVGWLLVAFAVVAGHLPEKLGLALGWATITFVDGWLEYQRLSEIAALS